MENIRFDGNRSRTEPLVGILPCSDVLGHDWLHCKPDVSPPLPTIMSYFPGGPCACGKLSKG